MTTPARALAVAVAVLACEPAYAACVVPSREALAPRDLAGCCTLITGPLGGAGPDLRWVAVDSEGPLDGKLYVLSCGGVKVAATDSLGYVERVDPGPTIGGMPTVAVAYVPATGTSIDLHSVALAQYRAGQVRILWKHATLDSVSVPPLIGQSYEERTSWRFVQGRSRIEAVTLRMVPTRRFIETHSGPSLVGTLPSKSRRIIKLPAERYCLRASVWRYVPCD